MALADASGSLPATVLPRLPLSPRLPASLRLVRRLFRAIARWPLGWQLELVGGENLPRDPAGRLRGGWIAAGLPHVTWVEPFLMFMLLPGEPRLVWFGDGRAVYRTRLRRLAFARLGGVVPIWPGGGPRAFQAHLAAARRILDAGAVFAIFPEVGGPVPAGQARPLGAGLGYLALRTGAPIVPLAFGGTDELFLGRRLRLVVLPAVTAAELAGRSSQRTSPAAGSGEERLEAHRIVAALHDRMAGAVADAHRATVPRPGARRRWPWLTHLLR
ncbi:MAG: lysophospholipid acyltransferase family protein [Candidatus Limnocylindrales bacterium]